MLAASVEEKQHLAPPQVVLAKNVRIKIRDLRNQDPDALQSFSKIKFTEHEVGVTRDKHIVIAGFGTTTTLLEHHFQTLKKLSRRVQLLKHAHRAQGNEEKSWEEIERVVEVLDRAIEYLNTGKEQVQECVPGSEQLEETSIY